MTALPPLLCSDAALMRLVGFKAPQGRQGVCQRGAATRQGPRTAGPICPDTLAENLVQLHLRDLEAVFNGVIRALAQRGVLAAKVTGIVAATALETTAQYEGCGHVPRKRTVTDTRGKGHEIAVTVDGVNLSRLIDARTKIPLAGKGGRFTRMQCARCGPWSRRREPSWRALPAGTRWSARQAFGLGWSGGGWRSTGSWWWYQPRTPWR
jgi:hypothetical protein